MSSAAPKLHEHPLPRPGAPPAPRVPRPERWVLSNGLRVAAVARRELPQVALRLVVPAGSAADPAAHPGTAALVGALLTEGTAAFGAEALNARIDALGASAHVQVGHDFAEVDLVLLSETLSEGLELFAEIVASPAFPAAEVERIRAETLDALEARLDEPANVADDRVSLEVYGEGHPYGRLTSGTPKAVGAVPREALVAFHAARYRPEGSVLVAAGDFDPDDLHALLERCLSDWEGVTPLLAVPPTPSLPVGAGRHAVVRWPDAAQGEIRLAGVGMERRSPDWIPAAVANHLLGGSTITGRLGANLREDKGWTYGVRSGLAAALRAGGWIVETAVELEVVEAAVAEILAELERFAGEPVSAEELRRAKDAMILSLPRAFESPGRIVSRFGTLEAFGLETDYWERFPERVEAVTPEEVLRLANEYFHPHRLVRVVVGKG